MAKAQDELVFVALGGVGEIGMNMAAYGFGPEGRRKWIVVDCGVSFGGPQQPGIELIMADPSFLEEVADDVLALVLTHSHEDHYGAVLDLWPAFERPVYCTAFTAAMPESLPLDAAHLAREAGVPQLAEHASKLGAGLRLSPASTQTDGFYIAVMTKSR